MSSEPPAADAKPKKKERAPPPPPPAAISTACLLVRYALTSILSSSNDAPPPLECAPFQATFLKDKPRLTGRVGVTANKAAAAATPLLDDKATGLTAPLTPDHVWDALQAILTRVLTSDDDYSIAYATVTKQDLADAYGGGEAVWTRVLEESHVGKKSKTKPNDPLVLALLKHGDVVVFACIVPGIPYASPSSALSSIALEAGQGDVKAGKKGVLVSVKWEATVKQGADEATATPLEALPSSLPLALSPTPPEVGALLTQINNHVQQQQQEAAAQEAAAKEQEAAAAAKTTTEMKVDPFNVEGTIDYDKLVEQFGSTLLDEGLLKRFEALTVGQQRVPHLHRFLRRNIFFSHRSLDKVVSVLEQAQQQPSSSSSSSGANHCPLYLYTGRGPSSSAMHLGHLVPFLFTQWLQQALDCPLVIQMTDDEKFIFKGEYEETVGDNLLHFYDLTMENARDIIACGFDFEKTFLFSDLDYMGKLYPNVCRIWKACTTNTVQNMFGFDGSSNMGKVAFPAIQAAPSFASSFPIALNVPEAQRRQTPTMCLIPCAIDQDPYFRMTRDVAHKLVDKTVHPLQGKPALVHSKFFPPLQGAQGKMSSSNTNSAIFLTDTPDQIADKIRNHCFSGGRETKAEQEALGADLEVDVAYQWLRFFLEDDDELQRIGKDYGTGSGEYWATNKVKERLIAVLQDLVAAHQARRAKITDEEVRKWMTERCIVGPTTTSSSSSS